MGALSKSVVGAAITVGLLVGGGTGASAATSSGSVDDPSNDVSYEAPLTPSDLSDITLATITIGKKNVTLELTFAKLRPGTVRIVKSFVASEDWGEGAASYYLGWTNIIGVEGLDKAGLYKPNGRFVKGSAADVDIRTGVDGTFSISIPRESFTPKGETGKIQSISGYAEAGDLAKNKVDYRWVDGTNTFAASPLP